VSGSGRPETGLPDGTRIRLAIAASQWHDGVTGWLLDRAVAAAQACRADGPLVVRVPGAAELPVVAAELARRTDAVACVGAVIRGGTPHFDYVCQAVTYGLAKVAVESGVPVGNGVLTCDSLAQALDRSGRPGSSEDKGFDAVLAAVRTALVLRGLRSQAEAG
jgi:6,7-dimethyl-8-ribityllumazine synthase